MEWLQTLLAWDWATILRSAVGAGLGTAAVTGTWTFYLDYRRRKAQAGYMAMRLAVILESFAHDCILFIWGNDSAQAGPDGEYPDWNLTLPKLSPYPDDTDGWRVIDQKLACRCLNLRNRISSSQSLIWGRRVLDRVNLEDLTETAAARGLEAWSLAEDLRKRHGIGDVETVWDYASELKQKKLQAEEAQKHRSSKIIGGEGAWEASGDDSPKESI
jgi:hypothetical protein